MRTSFITAALTAFAGFTDASPLTERSASNGQVAVYWGYGPQRPLSAYCAPGEGINTLILAFLSNFGGGNYPNGAFGPNCRINSDGSFTSGCAGLAQQIQTCQNAGVKVFASIGGGGAAWQINGSSDASKIASNLWKSYGGNLTNNNAPRPFGNVVLDGWDMDIESNPKNQSELYLGDLVNSLRSKFSQDPTRTYYISGAPQCPLPELNMGQAMNEAQFDYIWIQFYNNNCGAADLVKSSTGNPDGAGSYNFNSWPTYLAKGKSKNAALYVGLPASTKASPAWFWLKPAQIFTVIKNSPGFSGIMLWNAAYSDQASSNGCTYAQSITSIFQTGKLCKSTS